MKKSKIGQSVVHAENSIEAALYGATLAVGFNRDAAA